MDDMKQYCQEAFDKWLVLSSALPEDNPSRFPYGYIEIGFVLDGITCPLSMAQLKDDLATARSASMNGRLPFREDSHPDRKAYALDGDIMEAWLGCPVSGWLFSKPIEAEFWRASLNGMFYTIRGYEEDGSMRLRPGSMIELTRPVWRVGEAAYVAVGLASQLDDVQNVSMYVHFKGLKNRKLGSITSRHFNPDTDESVRDEIERDMTVSITHMKSNLAEVVHGLLEDLYFGFGQYPLTIEFVAGELNEMQAAHGLA